MTLDSLGTWCSTKSGPQGRGCGCGLGPRVKPSLYPGPADKSPAPRCMPSDNHMLLTVASTVCGPVLSVTHVISFSPQGTPVGWALLLASSPMGEVTGSVQGLSKGHWTRG